MVSRIITTLLVAVFIVGCGRDTAQSSSVDINIKVRSQELYLSKCASCHGKDGRLGLSGAQDLTQSQLAPEEVKGVIADGKGAMVGFNKLLTAEEIDMVVDYVQGLKE